LIQAGLERNVTAAQALGYRQVSEHLRGQRSLPETIELVKIRTRQFAKRQATWFKKQHPDTKVDLAPEDALPLIAERLTQAYRSCYKL